MREYYDLIISVFEKDTNAFMDIMEYEFIVAIDYKNKQKRTTLLRAIQMKLLVVYGIKVEGVSDTPSKIVDLLELVNSLLQIEK